jgi:hypothetical protein
MAQGGELHPASEGVGHGAPEATPEHV